jgi:ABC-2 type transport system ATP-binding protein
MIRVRGLNVDYEDVRAVSGMELDVPAGDVCGLIGPNGAGKTTTMRSIVGLIEPTDGLIEVAGVDMRERPQDARRLVAFMPDFAPLYDDLKVWEFLDLFAASYFVPKTRRTETVDRYLDIVGLTEKRDAMVLTLSRGMRQRLMLAKSFIHEPRVLLLDEPASGMDPQGRIDLKNVLKRLGNEGCSVLISSHILAEMTEFCTSIAIMERGRLVIAGPVEEIRQRIMGASVYELTVIGPPARDRVAAILADDPLVGPLEGVDGTLAFPFAGDTEQASDLLATLIKGGVRVASFAPRREGLEGLFLKVGARELS